MDKQQHDRKEGRSANIGFKKLAVQWLQDVQFSNGTFVVTDSLRLRNRQLLVAAKRWLQCQFISQVDSDR